MSAIRCAIGKIAGRRPIPSRKKITAGHLVSDDVVGVKTEVRHSPSGMRIDVAITKNPIFGVDTPEHLEKARALLSGRG